MGYCTDSRGRLACDGCGNVGGVRKRTCPHTVVTDALRGTRGRLPYCSPPALCAACFTKYGGTRKIHAECKAGAAASQARYDLIQARLDAGEWGVVAAVGDWHEGVPPGMVEVTFWRAGGSANGEQRLLVPKDEYQPHDKPFLSDYTTTPV